jgi:cytosine/adenosine deaminase-related metal-dependent hydrolase
LFGGRSVREFIEALAAAPRSLVIHGNYLTDDEIALAAQHAQRMTVVYCPRTHAYFGHPPYPLARMLAAGVAMAVGTDSRASNPDLSLLEELRQIASRHADVPPAKILELGTLAGARALGWRRELGSLGFFKRADFCVIPIGARNADDPHDLLFDCEARASETWIDGRCVARTEGAA